MVPAPTRFLSAPDRIAQDAEMEPAEMLGASLKVFRKLNAIAEETGMSRAACLREAATLIRKQKRSKQKRANKPLVAYRWEKVPAAERSRIARELAQKRWANRGGA
jgi:hypothetical protein